MEELEPLQKTIKGRTYTVARMPAFRALDVFEMLTSLVGPGAVSMLGLNDDISKVSHALFAKLGGGKIKELARALLDGVIVEENGKNSPMLTGFDLRYAGKLWEVFQVMAFVVEANYSDFYDGARTVLARLFSKEGEATTSSPSSPSASREDGSPSNSGNAGT